MKINTEKIARKYQVGGAIIYQPVSGPPMPTPGAGAVPTQPSPTTEESSGPLDKEYIKKLMGAGITNDVHAFSEMVNQAYSQYSAMTPLERETNSGRRLRELMKGDLGQMNQLQRNKDLFTEVVSNMQKNNAGSDFAVTARGVIVKDLESGRIAEVSNEEYASQLRGNSKYKMLTNSELVNEREYNPQLINDMQSINALGNAVGMNQVKDEVRNILKDLGSDSKKQSNTSFLGYGTTQDASIEKAAQQIVGMGAKGYYKLTDMASNDSNLDNLQLAAQAMWDNLSENSRNLLKARAASRGITASNLDEAAKTMAISLLTPASKTTQEKSRSLDYDSQMTNDVIGSRGGKGGSDKLDDTIGYWQATVSGDGDPRHLEISDGKGSKLTAIGTVTGAFQEKDGIVGATSIRNIPSLHQFINDQNIIIGDNQINPELKNSIIYEGGPVMNVVLPVVNEGGVLKPDRKNADLYVEIQNKLSQVPAGNVAAKEKIIQSSGLPSDGRGNIKMITARFLTFTGSVANAAMTEDAKTNWLQELGSEAKEDYISKYTKDNKGKDVPGSDIIGSRLISWFPGANSSDVSRGQVFMLLKDSVGDIQGRMADGKGINVYKQMNTSDYLGTSDERARMNGAGSSAPRYGLIE